MTPDEISSDSSGNLSYTEEGKYKRTIKRKDYIYAWIPRPADIKAADELAKEKDSSAAREYAALAVKYKHLGWEIYCLRMEAQSLYDAGKKDDAGKILAPLAKQNSESAEKDETDILEAQKLLAAIFMEKKDYKNADELLSELIKSSNDDFAAAALNAKGDIFAAKGDKKEAALMYLQTALLFPSAAQERPAALMKLANTLKELNDKRSAIFADKLKKEYPKSPFIKDLK